MKSISKEQKKICVICRRKYKGYGNNALPLIDGQCCDSCNDRLIIPLRINLHFAFEKQRKDILEVYGVQE